MGRYIENYIGYELGYFLSPKYKGSENCELFFLLLQNPNPNQNSENFFVKLGKTRFLNGDFKADCQKVLVYLSTENEQFTIYNIELSTNKNGEKYFDAVSFLDTLEIEYSLCDTSHYRYFKSNLRGSRVRKELILHENNTKFSVINRRINADDCESLTTYYNH